jgi:hypothetical protein
VSPVKYKQGFYIPEDGIFRGLTYLLHQTHDAGTPTCAIWFPAMLSSLPVSGSTAGCASSAVLLESSQPLKTCESAPSRGTITHITPLSGTLCHGVHI